MVHLLKLIKQNNKKKELIASNACHYSNNLEVKLVTEIGSML
jgi:hypothetical protein